MQNQLPVNRKLDMNCYENNVDTFHDDLPTFTEEDVQQFIDMFAADTAPFICKDDITQQITIAPMRFIHGTARKVITGCRGSMILIDNPSPTLLELFHLAVQCLCRSVLSVMIEESVCIMYTDIQPNDVDFSSTNETCHFCLSRYASLFECVQCNRKQCCTTLMHP
jgi:predicted lipase